jgi:hypothetical protein
MFRCCEQASPISEGVVEIIINGQPCKGNNLTTQHTWAKRAPRVAIVHDKVKELGQVLPRPSAIFHVSTSADSLWVARHYPFYTSKSEVRYHLTRWHTKILSLRDPITHVCTNT